MSHRIRISAMVGCLLLLCILLAACGGDKPDTETGPESVTAADTAAPAPETQPEGTEPASQEEIEPATEPAETLAPDVLVETVGFSASQAGATGTAVLSVADFGAVGDGVTDDGPAVCLAVQAAVEQHATLTFEAGKTYCILTSPTQIDKQNGPMALSNASGVTIDGQGATLKVTPGLCYFAFMGCSDIKICNFVFDYTVPVYLVGTVTSVRPTKVTMTVDIDPYMDSYDFTAVNGFSIQYNEGMQQRPHAFMGQMTVKGDKTVLVDYPNGASCSKGDKIFLPNPGVGHAYNAPITISECTGAVVCENITVRAASTMSVVVSSNNAEIYFENTDLMPDLNDGREIHMVGWRDGFHCSDNRLPIHWNNCDTGVMFDDTFNIYGALGYVLSVNETNSVTACHWGKYRVGTYQAADIRAGDVLDFYDNTLGKYYGCVTVREAVINADGTTTVYFEYGQELPELPVGAQIANRSTGAPGSTMKDCHFVGTYRFHRGLRFENCAFDLLCMWIMVEDNLEGPLPGDIDFINCTFSGPPQIDALNRGGNKYMSEIGKQITDIGFWGCTMEGEMRSRSEAGWTVSDSWTEADLFTVKNAKPATVNAAEITPARRDLLQGASYDWAYHTMPVGGASPIAVRAVDDQALRTAMETDSGFTGRVLRLNGDTLTLEGLAPDKLPGLYHEGDRITVTMTVISDKDGTCTLKAEGLGESEAASCKAGVPAVVTFTTVSRASGGSWTLTFTGGGTVYIGTVRVEMIDNANPAVSRLDEPYTFIWTDEVRIGAGTPVATDALSDETVKKAIADASGFTSGTVLHITDGFGDFTCLTDPSYYKAGQKYFLTLDAYIAAPTDGAEIALCVRDASETGYRVISDGLFTSQGLYHFEGYWEVGETGESALAIVMNGTPAQSPDVYIGDFTVTACISYKPSHFEDIWMFANVTEEEWHEGFLFDFSKGHIMDFGLWGTDYAAVGSFDPRVRAALKAAGYGDLVYYLNRNTHLYSVEWIFPGGHQFTIVADVYDCIGNLAEPGDSPALIIRNLIDGQDTTPYVNYTAETDPNDSRHVTLTFTVDLTGPAPACYTTDIIFARADDTAEIEMIIGSIFVRMDK